jgi:hypothetical protein
MAGVAGFSDGVIRGAPSGTGVGIGPPNVRPVSGDGIGIDDGLGERVGTGWARACTAKRARTKTMAKAAGMDRKLKMEKGRM